MGISANIKVGGIETVDLRPASAIQVPERRVVIPYAPRKVFGPLHGAEQRFGIAVCHRRCGKTVASINQLIKVIMTCNLESPRGAYIAPTYAQAKDIAWDYIKRYTKTIPGVRYHEADLKVTFPNGGTIRLYGAENIDRLRGLYFDMVIIDEYASLDSKIWTEVVYPTLVDRNGKAFFLGTPKGKDAFFDLWRKALKDPQNWFHLMLKASETGIVPLEELAALRGQMSYAQYMREFECSFEVEGDDQFISKQMVDEAIQRQAAATGPVIIGVDIARFGDDRTVIVVRDGDRIRDIRVWREADLMTTAARVSYAIEEHRPQVTCIDGIGVGAGVVDRLRQMGYPRIEDVNTGRRSSQPSKYGNLRSEIWDKMRAWVTERAQLPDNDELASDLTSLLYTYDNTNRLRLESKEDLKARDLPSPDLADALALTFAVHVAPKDMNTHFNRNSAMATPTADPFTDLFHDPY